MKYPVRMKYYLMLNLSTGYLESGDNEDARRILDSFNAFPNTKYGAIYSVCFYNNLTVYYFRMNELNKGEESLKRMKEFPDG